MMSLQSKLPSNNVLQVMIVTTAITIVSASRTSRDFDTHSCQDYDSPSCLDHPPSTLPRSSSQSTFFDPPDPEESYTRHAPQSPDVEKDPTTSFNDENRLFYDSTISLDSYFPPLRKPQSSFYQENFFTKIPRGSAQEYQGPLPLLDTKSMAIKDEILELALLKAHEPTMETKQPSPFNDQTSDSNYEYHHKSLNFASDINPVADGLTSTTRTAASSVSTNNFNEHLGSDLLHPPPPPPSTSLSQNLGVQTRPNSLPQIESSFHTAGQSLLNDPTYTIQAITRLTSLPINEDYEHHPVKNQFHQMVMSHNSAKSSSHDYRKILEQSIIPKFESQLQNLDHNFHIHDAKLSYLRYKSPEMFDPMKMTVHSSPFVTVPVNSINQEIKLMNKLNSELNKDSQFVLPVSEQNDQIPSGFQRQSRNPSEVKYFVPSINLNPEKSAIMAQTFLY